MKKIFKGFKISNFISTLIIGLFYPIIKTAISNNKLLVFSDTTFIISLFFLVFGVLNNLFLHGDFDITTYITKKVFVKDKEPYDVFKENMKEKREDSFNYPLFVGILLFVISIITSRLV